MLEAWYLGWEVLSRVWANAFGLGDVASQGTELERMWV